MIYDIFAGIYFSLKYMWCMDAPEPQNSGHDCNMASIFHLMEPLWRHQMETIPVTGHLWGESTGHRWIPLNKASDAELWCFLWSAPEHTLEQNSRRQWFKTPSCSWWRQCDTIRMRRLIEFNANKSWRSMPRITLIFQYMAFGYTIQAQAIML